MDEEVGLAQVAFELGDLVLEHETVAKRVPGQLAEQLVVLVHVGGAMGEDDVGRQRLAQLVEVLLDLGSPTKGK